MKRQSCTQLLNAIASATRDHAYGSSTEGQAVTAQVEEEHQITRDQNTAKVDSNQETMKQEIAGLQRGLRQLESEIDRKVGELKSLVVKINTTHEGPERRLLNENGNSTAVILMSLYELYKSL